MTNYKINLQALCLLFIAIAPLKAHAFSSDLNLGIVQLDDIHGAITKDALVGKISYQTIEDADGNSMKLGFSYYAVKHIGGENSNEDLKILKGPHLHFDDEALARSWARIRTLRAKAIAEILAAGKMKGDGKYNLAKKSR